MKKLILHGQQLSTQQLVDHPDSDERLNIYESVEIYQINVTRSNKKEIELPYDPDNLIELIFEDGSEWLTSSFEDLEKLFPQNSQRSKKKDAFEIPDFITLPSPNQRGIKKFFLKLLKLYRLPKKVKKNLGQLVDKKIKENEVLHHLKNPSYFESFQIDSANQSKYLLLLHGFGSSTKGSFGDFGDSQLKVFWAKMTSLYQENILAYDHHTISKSPIQNAIDLLEQLPNKVKLDILAYSRGGLIADLLAKCSIKGEKPSSFFTKEDFEKLEGQQKEELEVLEKLAKKKQIEIDRVIRVASPARGTVLLDDRLSLFLNVIMNGVKVATGGVLSPVYGIIKRFLMDVIKSGSNPEVFPGIAAMVPKSSFQQLINHTDRKTHDQLVVIEGASRFGHNLKQSLLVILTKLVFIQKNDFVVNTNSMRFGVKRTDGVQILLSQNARTTHFKYFTNSFTQKAISRAFEWDGEGPLEEFEHIPSKELENQFKDNSFKIESRRGQMQGPDLTDYLTEMFSGDVSSSVTTPINLFITHADLKFAEYPVMVGHFAEDGIVSAEQALDYALERKLTDRYMFGNYPANKNESIIIIAPKSEPKGGIVIGLGENINFSEAELRKSVEKGILEYAIYLRDVIRNLKDTNGNAINDDFPYHGISSLFIGSSYGNLDMESSITAILFGVHKANEKIEDLNKYNEATGPEGKNGRKYVYPITDIEFIDIYDDVTRKAYYSLEQISNMDYTLNIKKPTEIELKHGAQKRIEHRRNLTWWHNLMTESEPEATNSPNSGIRFITSSGKAKVEEVTDFFSTQLVDELVERMSTSPNFSKEVSNSLYHLLIPSRIKQELKNQRNILWKLTPDTAKYPWEMIHDKDLDEEPVFVNSGMIRQLISKSPDSLERIIREPSALIIGDPQYEGYYQLPAALDEAKTLNEKLKKAEGWKVKFLERENLSIIVSSILNLKYKLLHIAGHGVYDTKTGQSGIVVGNTVLDSVFFSKLPYLPEFAFINCCFTGDIDTKFEEIYRDRYKLAASIGVQLIEMGVQAVVITGWAVHDRAAEVFAAEFYRLMLMGETFGRAVQRARKKTYSTHPYSNTWAAYQCYGDPWYTLVKKDNKNNLKESYLREDEVLVDLYNIQSKKIDKFEVKETMLSNAKHVFSTARKSKMATPLVYEKMAEIYAGFDELDEAIKYYDDMRKMDSAKYSVKALEQYCNLQIKKFVRDIEKNRKKGEKITEPIDDQKKLITNFDLLLNIAITPERYNLLGSANKRFAYVFENFSTYIEDTVINYQGAFNLAKNDVKKYTYPLSNLLQAQFFSNSNKPTGTNSKEEDAKFISAVEWINDAEHKLREIDAEHKNFWEDIALINILTTKILYEAKSKTIKDTSKEIIKTYRELFTSGGSLKNLRSEIEQFDFLIRMTERILNFEDHRHNENADLTKEKLKELKKIRTSLIKLNNSKTQTTDGSPN